MTRARQTEIGGSRVVAVWGLGRFGGGLGAAEELLRRGNTLRIIDRATRDQLAESLVRLERSAGPIEVLEEAESSLDGVDLVCVNPGVRPDHPLLEAAQRRGIPCTQELDLFLDAYPGRVTAVTGTNGKSSTTLMLARALEAATGRMTLEGGNLGGSLFDHRARWRADQDCVLEVSSFQASRLRLDARPFSGLVIPYLGTDHIDWHGDRGAYHAAKLRLLGGLKEGAPALLGGRGPSREGAIDDRLHLLSPTDEPISTPAGLEWRGVPVLTRRDIVAQGDFQLDNARLALALVERYGLDVRRAAKGLRGFAGLPHRLVRVGKRSGVTFFDNGVSTGPESSLSALRTLRDQGPTRWIGGGRSKDGDLTPYDEIASFARSVHLFGEVAPALSERLRAHGIDVTRHTTCREALEDAWNRCEHGDQLVFSPGFASFDQYPNFEARARVALAWWHSRTGDTARGARPESSETSAGE
ncbi:MAG: UDP-N-acetylmuramoyl-L-alanine--D-glutamate ligase [Planctomycetes bacterium]|nr:UDP-N-acetylmuramoyl-L-alanine--D-glutamate ligase [Planctomycetota bacterium]